MSASTATHCPTCAAPIREESACFCSYCGTKLPEAPAPTTVVVQERTPTSAERFEAAKRLSNLATLHARGHGAPSALPTKTTARLTLAILAGGAVAAALLAFLSAVAIVAFSPPDSGREVDALFSALFGVMFLVISATLGIAAIVTGRKARPSKPGETVRTLAVVVDERVEYRGGHSSAWTGYFVTLEFENRDRREYQVSGPFAGIVKVGDLGLADVRGSALIEFHRLDA